ncbi:xyloside xylosyltransferase 1 [Tachysurus ichikawai]
MNFFQLHLDLSSASSSVTPSTYMSSITTSVDLVLDFPLLLLPSAYFFQYSIYPISLLMYVVFHDVNGLTEKLFPIVEAMQKHFSAGSGAYYSDAIFFLSVAMHRIMPTGEL